MGGGGKAMRPLPICEFHNKQANNRSGQQVGPSARAVVVVVLVEGVLSTGSPCLLLFLMGHKI